MLSASGITIQDPVQPSITSPTTRSGVIAGSTEVPTRRGKGAPRRVLAPKRRRASEWISATSGTDPDHVEPERRYPPEGGIRPKEILGSILLETPLLRDLAQHPSTAVHRCEV